MEQNLRDQIRDARISKGYTQLKLANAIDISLDTISGIESGRKENISISMLKKIGTELDLKFEI